MCRNAVMTLAACCVGNTHTHTVTGVRSHMTRGALRVARLGTLRTNVTVKGFRVRDGCTVCRRWSGRQKWGRNEWIACSTCSGMKAMAKQGRMRLTWQREWELEWKCEQNVISYALNYWGNCTVFFLLAFSVLLHIYSRGCDWISWIWTRLHCD